jgi:GNAT superfamily N-acetyltransferase
VVLLGRLGPGCGHSNPKARRGKVVSEYTVRPLNVDTWDAFVHLGEKHNGVWNGCWCTAFHPTRGEQYKGWEGSRAYKAFMVREGRAHAALVFDGAMAIGWCQYGTPEELPNIYHKREYQAGLKSLPDFRITCFFVDRHHRRSGVAAVALAGALDLIAQAGGGVVEAYPQDTPGKKTSASFLYNATRNLFEQAGFEYERPKGKNHCVMRKVVLPGAAGVDGDPR